MPGVVMRTHQIIWVVPSLRVKVNFSVGCRTQIRTDDQNTDSEILKNGSF